ncbi:MAG TPA: nuclear transport factor 2 family protein [Sphingomicrobium sp.]|nr:nuclear transport factor 2 family protein [Sphingomicrobium sp.]
MFRRALLAAVLAGSVGLSDRAEAGPAEDATAAVTIMLDKFNAGDVEAFYAAHQDGALIVDEFAPYLWGGSGSARHWVGDYMKDAEGKGVSGGRIDYGKPVQAISNGRAAYVVLPTTYRFVRNGTKMEGKGSMTFVMTRVGDVWKIASWTYSGATAQPE